LINSTRVTVNTKSNFQQHYRMPSQVIEEVFLFI
jgi:hypothetical protein